MDTRHNEKSLCFGSGWTPLNRGSLINSIGHYGQVMHVISNTIFINWKIQIIMDNLKRIYADYIEHCYCMWLLFKTARVYSPFHFYLFLIGMSPLLSPFLKVFLLCDISSFWRNCIKIVSYGCHNMHQSVGTENTFHKIIYLPSMRTHEKNSFLGSLPEIN